MANPIRPTFLDDPTMSDFAKALGEYMYTSQVSNHTQLTSIDSRLSDFTTSSQDNTRAISNLQAEVRSSRLVVDQCELRFPDVPDSSPLSDEELAMKILTAMQCADRVGPLLSVRRWDFPPARPIPAQGTNPSTSQLTPAGNFNPNEVTKPKTVELRRLNNVNGDELHRLIILSLPSTIYAPGTGMPSDPRSDISLEDQTLSRPIFSFLPRVHMPPSPNPLVNSSH
ncbi:hypothetical protein QAD02_007320 [Eretmocerus hayati]|uniref:Uncharacterized protein n=2 Tax=Eretmocerus hayati TaxID=131215 RepID=A0ACC2N457_9HYME|nr:hypothetical protein QAD02_007318 [Eretmocerus hayati]KAJ8665658.1 hypothetical protein QAD02_007320 [Eretmocerus hayati]